MFLVEGFDTSKSILEYGIEFTVPPTSADDPSMPTGTITGSIPQLTTVAVMLKSSDNTAILGDAANVAVKDSSSPAGIFSNESSDREIEKSFPSTLLSSDMSWVAVPMFFTVQETVTGAFCSGWTLMLTVDLYTWLMLLSCCSTPLLG